MLFEDFHSRLRQSKRDWIHHSTCNNQKTQSMYETTAFQDSGNRQARSGVPDRLDTMRWAPWLSPAYCLKDFSGFGSGKEDWGEVQWTPWLWGHEVENLRRQKQLEFSVWIIRKEWATERGLWRAAKGTSQVLSICKWGNYPRPEKEPSEKIRRNGQTERTHTS